MFKEGQKVVCVGRPGGQRKPSRGEVYPVNGEIYTIRQNVSGRVPLIRLVEIINPILDYLHGPDEIAFDQSGFRPIDYEFGESVCEELEKITEPELV